MADPTLLTISGALRKDSYNRMLLAEAARAFGPAQVIEADLHLPLYDGDLEDAQGVPDGVHRLVEQIAAADAVVISSPEYNKGITGVLKNALDWLSRVKENPFKAKPTVVMSANAGRTGGEAGQFMLLACLMSYHQPDVLPGPMLCVAAAGDEFDAQGRLTNDHYLKLLSGKMQALRDRAAG